MTGVRDAIGIETAGAMAAGHIQTLGAASMIVWTTASTFANASAIATGRATITVMIAVTTAAMTGGTTAAMIGGTIIGTIITDPYTK
jgi:hypothetical protein